MSLENDVVELQKLILADDQGLIKRLDEADIFKPASKAEVKSRAEKARELAARESIIQVRKHRNCSICGNDLAANEWYLKVNTAGNYSGGTVCRTCLNVAANELATKL
jgi:hypothetical protein